MRCLFSLIRCRPAVIGALLEDGNERQVQYATQWRVSFVGKCQAANFFHIHDVLLVYHT